MQNFGKIKNVLNNIMIEGIVNKKADGQRLFKKYLRTIKESEILKTQFLIYSNLENRVDSDLVSVNNFIGENIKLLETFTKEDILKENERLLKLVKVDAKLFDEDYELKSLHESVSNLIFTKKTAKNLGPIADEIKKISNYITSNKINESEKSIPTIDFPPSALMKILVDKFNTKYQGLDEDVKKTFKRLLEGDLNRAQKIYEDIVTECKTLVDAHLTTAEDDYRSKLLQVREKLEAEVVLNEENRLSRVFKLMELRNDLKKIN